jgi:hypothetical protein
MVLDFLFRCTITIFFIVAIMSYGRMVVRFNFFDFRLWFVGGLIYFYLSPIVVMVLYGFYQAPLFPITYLAENTSYRMPVFALVSFISILTILLSLLRPRAKRIVENRSKVFIPAEYALWRRFSQITSVSLITLVLIKILLSGGIYEYFNAYWYSRGAAASQAIGHGAYLLFEFFTEGMLICCTAGVVGVNYISRCHSVDKGILQANLLFFFAAFVFLIASGNRIHIVWALFGYMLLSLQIVGWRSIWRLGLIASLIAVPAMAWTFVRGNLLNLAVATENIGNYSELISSKDKLFFVVMSVFEPVGGLVLLETLKEFSSENYLLGKTIYGGFLSNIGLIASGESTNISVIMGELIINEEGMSLPPGILGELFANFGIAGLVLLFLGLVVSHLLARNSHSPNTLNGFVFASLAVMGLAIVRFPLVTGLAITANVVLISVVLTFLVAKLPLKNQ